MRNGGRLVVPTVLARFKWFGSIRRQLFLSLLSLFPRLVLILCCILIFIGNRFRRAFSDGRADERAATKAVDRLRSGRVARSNRTAGQGLGYKEGKTSEQFDLLIRLLYVRLCGGQLRSLLSTNREKMGYISSQRIDV